MELEVYAERHGNRNFEEKIIDEEIVTILQNNIETVVETNSRLEFTNRRGDTEHTHQISIISIDTDEGVLEPLGVGEILLEVRY